MDGAKQLINDEPVLNSLSSELSISLNVSTVQMVLLVNTANSGIKILFLNMTEICLCILGLIPTNHSIDRCQSIEINRF